MTTPNNHASIDTENASAYLRSADQPDSKGPGSRSQTLYRKWRSQTFDELVGQEAITRTLQNAITSGRVGHAYLFCGPRGTGKTSTGRLLAKAVNCLNEDPFQRPCDKCEACRSIAEARALDLIEIDAASNRGIDEIRELRDKINFQPAYLKKKVYIIDEVHMMTDAAFNALLKTLEEPPAHALFILATTDPQDIPATVVSRCQRFDFQRISLEQIVARLSFVCEQENVKAETAALELVARQATGSLRDALSMLDQLIVFSAGNISLDSVRLMLGVMNIEAVADFVDSLIASDVSGGLDQINRLVQSGTDMKRFNRELVEHLRNLMLIKANPNGREINDLTAEAAARMIEQAQRLELVTIIYFLKIFSGVDYSLKVSPYGQLPLEIALLESILGTQLTATKPVTEQVSPVPRATPAAAARPEAAKPVPPSKPAPVAEVAPVIEKITLVSAETVVKNEQQEVVAEIQSEVVKAEIVSGGTLELTTVEQAWRRTRENVEATNKVIGALLKEARPVAVNGNRVSLAFAYEFHRNRINQDVVRHSVEDHLSKVVGMQVTIECIDDTGQGGRKTTTTPAKPDPRPQDNDRARKAADFFNARILD